MKLETIRKHAEKGRSLREFKKGSVIKGGGSMSLLVNYTYTLEEAPGTNFASDFKPVLTPQEMLYMGVFEGRYLNDCTDEFPKEWFLTALAAGTLSETPNIDVNYFGVASRQPLSVWRENGWVAGGKKGKATGRRAMLASKTENPDERGWFQWYCRYWMGRRLPELDSVQIARWRSFARHAGAVKKRCEKHDLSCSLKERQALLQWSYDPFL